MIDSPSESLVIEFLGLLLVDRAAGRERSLAEYLELFPTAQVAVASAYLRSVGEAPRDHGEAPTETGATPGERRIGPYRLERELGRGGQAAVYLAHDDRLGRAVALKVVPRSPLHDELTPRFRREAQLTASLEHPGICTVFEAGHDETSAWIAMRFVEGETLAQRIARSGPLPVAFAIHLGRQAARALHAAHEAGVVHRDVKPSNVMITAEGDAVLLDFGVAHDEGAAEQLTRSGEALGTPAYMAPEAFRLPSAELGRAVDVWGLGVALYEALTGRRPFQAPTREALIEAIAGTEPAPPRRLRAEIPADLAIVVETALSKEPSRRYRTAQDFAEDLRRVAEHEPILARPAGFGVHLARFCRRNKALAAALGALMLVLAAGLAVTAFLWLRTARTLDEKEALLADFTQLSDQKVARDLLAEQEGLWPAVPERVAELRRWLDGAHALLDRVPGHRAALERPMAGAAGDGAPVAAAWLREQLEQLLADLDRLRARVPDVEARLAFATTVAARTLDACAQEWERASAAVAADPRFGDFRLAPQLGLVPLGADPGSRLEEFALLATGEPPRRDPSTGKLQLSESSALVLVLLPGGETVMGAMPPDAEHPEGGPHVDPRAGQWDHPLQHVRLDPFFIGKHEFTQGQWLRHTGENPATYQRDSRFVEDEGALMHPVETVNWTTSSRVVAQLGLELPTEAQWEYAARAGTTTVYFTGDAVESLQGAANLADRFAKDHEGHADWNYELGLDDGFTVHAPVGSFRPNAFGLHDVHGNVIEWCRDTWEDWSQNPPRDGDGLAPGKEGACIIRGGAYSTGADNARLGGRNGAPPNISNYTLGLRPARRVDPPRP